MNILLSNDDGIYAEGLRALYRALRARGHTVHAVAPMTGQSAVSNAITFFHPLQAERIVESDFEGMGVYGTPADCVKLGASTLVPSPLDLVISGMNAGANAGPNILYSGTVAAAAEGVFHNIPSMAVSYDSFEFENIDEHAAHAVSLAETLPWGKVPARTLLNVNYPAKPVSESLGVRACPQSSAMWRDGYEERHDMRGRPYWWLTGTLPPEEIEEGSDNDLLKKGYITVTPVRFIFTHEAFMPELEKILQK